MQPPRSRHRQSRDITDDRSKSAMAQPFFHAGQNGLVVSGLDMDHPVRHEAGLFEAGRKEILPEDAPQHLALRPRGDASDETRGCRTIQCTIAAARNLMQAAKRQPAARQPQVQPGNTERHHFAHTRAASLKLRDARAKGRKGWIDDALVHAEGKFRVYPKANPTTMFIICSIFA